MSRTSRASAARQAPIAPARIQVHIGRLIIDDLGTAAPEELVAALASELEGALGGLLAGGVPLGGTSVRTVAASVTLPARDGAGRAAEAAEAGRYGRAIGAALAAAVAGQAASPGSRAPGAGAPQAGKAER